MRGFETANTTLKSDLKDEPYILGEAPFRVSITTSDGCPASVTLTVTKGQDVIKLTADSSGSTFAIAILKTGLATIHAEELPATPSAKNIDTKTDKKAGRKVAPAVDWTLIVKEDTSTCIRDLLPQKLPKTPKADVSSIVQYLGNPYPYSFQVVGDKLLVYSTRQPAESERKTILATLNRAVQDLLALAQAARTNAAGAGSTTTTSALPSTIGSPVSTASPSQTPAYNIEVSIPHYAALGDLATLLNTLNYSEFTMQDVGSSKVRITSSTLPACSELTAFLRDLRDVVWKPIPENPVAKLFFLNASDLTGALSSNTSASTSGTTTSSQTAASASASPQAGAGTGAVGTGATAASGSATSPALGTPSSSTSTPAPATPTNSSLAPSPGSKASSPGGASGAATPAAGGSVSSTVTSTLAQPTVSSVGTDTLLFQDALPGDDALVTERRRLMALLDLPRPQMIINVWTLQASSNQGQAVANTIQEIHRQVDRYNDIIQAAVTNAWVYLRNQITQQDFDRIFYRYIVGRYVQDPIKQSADLSSELIPQETAGRILKRQTGPKMPQNCEAICKFAVPTNTASAIPNIFQPLKPRLTDLLLATIASKKPLDTMNAAVNHMEQVTAAPATTGDCTQADQDAALHGRIFLGMFPRRSCIPVYCAGIPTITPRYASRGASRFLIRVQAQPDVPA